jgi:hypothetical protein
LKEYEDEYQEINHPEHYESDGMQVIEVIRAFLSPEEYAGYCRGNQIKYLLRLYKKDTPTKNVGKSNWYGDRLARHLSE